MSAERTLVLAWGNPGRRDDGLGPALVAALAEGVPAEVTLATGYQLQVEDAADVAAHGRVFFVDADRRPGEEPFRFERLRPAAAPPAFTSHSLAPAELLAWSHDLFGHAPEAWLLGIRGAEFDAFGEGLSETATENLACAVDFVRSIFESDAAARDSAGEFTATLSPPTRG